jgi:hypothetical protein
MFDRKTTRATLRLYRNRIKARYPLVIEGFFYVFQTDTGKPG